MSDVRIPPAFRALIAGRTPAPTTSGHDWLRELPDLIDAHLALWELQPDGPAWHGECALVVPIAREGERLALKLTWPHPEARLERLALRAWGGTGAVQLVAADPGAFALLLERLDGDRNLTAEPILEACETIGVLLRRLDRPAPPQIPGLDFDGLVRQLDAGHPSVPRRMSVQAASLVGQLADGAERRLVHSDLHFANVLAAQRERWLAIDPKPVATELAYGVAPAVWNRGAEAVRAHNLRTHLRLRAEVIADAAGFDEDRVRAWTFVRLVLNALDAAPYLPSASELQGRMIASAKAFAD